MIADPELRTLFKTESEEYLQCLDEKLLSLEKNPKDQALLEETFRTAHSLKGSARLLGVSGVETIAHRFEDTLGDAKCGTTTLSSDVIDRMYRALDAIKKLVRESVTGEPANVELKAVLEQLESATLPKTAPEKPDAAVSPTEQTDVDPKQESPGQHSPHERFKIETIRVKPQRLDDLMTLIGELTVTKIQMARGVGELDEIVSIWEEWQRDFFVNRSLLSEEGAGPCPMAARDGGSAGGKRFREFFERQRERLERTGVLLQRLVKTSHEDNARLEFVANGLEDSIRSVRLLPLSTIFNLFPRMVRDLARQQSKEVGFFLDGGDTAVDKHILEELKDPLMHLIRNSIDHGLEPPEERRRHGKPPQGALRLSAHQTATSVVIELRDDGQGLNIDAIKRTAVQRKICRPEVLEAMTPDQVQALIFRPGFSTAQFVTELSGRGVGMDVVRTTVENLKGSVQVESTPGAGCAFRLNLPITVATARVLIVQVNQRPCALPVEFVEHSRLVSADEIFPIESRETVTQEGEPVSVVRLAELLELSSTQPPAQGKAAAPDARRWPCVFLEFGKERLGLLVDALQDEQEVVLKPLGGLLRRVRNVYGAAILGSGEVCMVLNPQDLMKSFRKLATQAVAAAPEPETEAPRKLAILLAEDSITTRTQEKRILEGAGYEVIVAVDGIDAFNKLGSRAFDAVVSDIQMPNLDGLGLTAKIRQDKKYNELPIILVTSLASEDDRRRGIEVGANAYLTKPSFDQALLLDTLRRLI